MDARTAPLGTHLLLELNECDAALLDDVDVVRRALLDAAAEAGATVVGEVFHKFSPMGVTGILSIAESHISVHTWPEYAYAAVDIFTCGVAFKPYAAANLIVQALRCDLHCITEIKRGAAIEPRNRLSPPVGSPRPTHAAHAASPAR